MTPTICHFETPEVWRPVWSVPDMLASSWGRIKSADRIGMTRGGSSRVYPGRASFGSWSERDQRYVTKLRRTGKNYKIARLVCEAFHGAPPTPDAVCMHLDENSRNNRPENLAWGTQKENLNAPGFLAYCRGRLGDNSPTTKGRKAKTA